VRGAAFALMLLLFSADGFAAGPVVSDDPECTSGRQCLAKAQAALAKREWRKAESLAALALDWAEPFDAGVTLRALRLAVRANIPDEPLRALAWAEAGLYYAGPWFGKSKRPPGVRQDIEDLYLRLVRQAESIPRGDALQGSFVRYAGRGIWNTLEIREVEPGRYHWQLDAYRVGGGAEPVMIRGPAQMSEGNEGIGTRTDDFLSIEYDDDYEPQHCHAAIRPSTRGVKVEPGTPDCTMGNLGVRPWGPYWRVETRK
jgi:hypothetical protein